jgi:hypothetical protein
MTTDTIATEADFTRHAQNLAAGFAAMSPAPAHRFTTNPNTMTTETTDQQPAPTPTPESTDARVLRESGIIGGFDLRWVGLANIESLTTGLATKKELARFAEIEAALSRLAEEMDASGKTPVNISKIAATLSPGELPTAEAIAAAVTGDEGRMARKKLIKESARRFFEEQAVPIIRDINTRAAALLETAITERHKAEVQAFEKFVEIYGDEDGTPYQPSKGLIRLLARRRQLLDQELTFTSPPSLRVSLAGVLSF